RVSPRSSSWHPQCQVATRSPRSEGERRDPIGPRSRRRLFEDELARRGVVWDRLWIVAVEAGEAEPVVRKVEGGEDAADREVAERVGTDEVADLVGRVSRGDQLGLDLGVDPVETRVVNRRWADP